MDQHQCLSLLQLSPKQPVLQLAYYNQSITTHNYCGGKGERLDLKLNISENDNAGAKINLLKSFATLGRVPTVSTFHDQQQRCHQILPQVASTEDTKRTLASVTSTDTN
jgi:hypothetical protein